MSLLALLALSAPVSARETAFSSEVIGEEAGLTEEVTARRPPSRIPYIACHLMGMVWTDTAASSPCFPTTTSSDFLRSSANDLAGMHNEVLANDYAIRGDTEITNDDAAEFLTTAADALCADGSCDAATISDAIFEQYGGLLNNSALENVAQILQWDVERGMISEDLGAQLQDLAKDVESGLYTADELQYRIEDLSLESWGERDLDAIYTLQATSRASYEAWGGTAGRKIPAKNVVDGLTTLGCGLLALSFGQAELLPAAASFGGWGSALYDNFFGRTTPPQAIRFEAIPSPISFEESVLINDSVYSVQGTISAKGGKVELRDADGNVVSGRAIKTTEKLLDPAALDELNAAAAGRKIYIPIWTGFGWLIVTLEIRVSSVVLL